MRTNPSAVTLYMNYAKKGGVGILDPHMRIWIIVGTIGLKNKTLIVSFESKLDPVLTKLMISLNK